MTSATGLWHRNAIVIQDGTEEINSVFGIPANDAPAGDLGPLGPEPNGPGATERDAEWQLSEELRITSTAPGPLQWVAGYFYQDLHSQFNQYLISPQAGPAIPSLDVPCFPAPGHYPERVLWRCIANGVLHCAEAVSSIEQSEAT